MSMARKTCCTDKELLDLIDRTALATVDKTVIKVAGSHVDDCLKAEVQQDTATGLERKTCYAKKHDKVEKNIASDAVDLKGPDAVGDNVHDALKKENADCAVQNGDVGDETLSDFDVLSKQELISRLHKCRTELDITRKMLERTERQLKKSNEYNGVIRKMVGKTPTFQLSQVYLDLG